MVFLFVGSGCPVSDGLNSLFSISISDVRYGTNVDVCFGYENDDRFLALTNVCIGWTLSGCTVYGFFVHVSLSAFSGDVGIFVKSVTSFW